MRKPTFYCCLKHCRIKAQANWVQVTDDFFTSPGTKQRAHLVFPNCEKCQSAIKKTKLVSWLSYVCRFQTKPSIGKNRHCCAHGLH
jgi:hypothetical protein